MIKWITGTVTEGRDVVICEQVLMEGQQRREGVEERVRRDKEGKRVAREKVA